MTERTPAPGSEDSADWEALARYLAGEAEPSEAAAIERWLEEDSARGRLLARLDRVLDPALVAPAADVDVEAALARTRARMAESAAHRVDPSRSVPSFATARPSRLAPFLRAAAVMALLLGAAFLFSLATRDRGVVEVARVHATGVAERDSLALVDGTRVLLGPGTRLTVLSGYGGTEREVFLEGEAMFQVTHDSERPFLVHVAGGVVEDLGTAFSVRTVAGEGAWVVVTEGAVRLRQDGDTNQAGVVLLQGDRGSFPVGGAPVAERGSATEEDLAWTRGILTFRESSLSEVAAALRRWYGFDLRFASGTDLASRRLTATFREESAEQVANVIALALGGRFEVRGDTIVIHPLEQP